jgi:GT2 family glycosyltransferase
MAIPNLPADGKELKDLITVIISTKNRWSSLEKALLSLQKQTLQCKIIVMDDHSEDGTSEQIKINFPKIDLYSFEESKGYIVRRNEAIKLAKTIYVLSIDDDCILENETILNEITIFCSRTNCAALAWPHIDVHTSAAVQNHAPTEALWQVCTFKGCSFVVHRHHFIETGGFRSVLIHQGEEEDFCIRLLNKGLPVILGRGHAIHHYESPKRNFDRMDFYGSRNLLLFAFFNVPIFFLPVQLLISSFKCILYGFKIKRPFQKTRGVLHGIIDGMKLIKQERRAVSVKTFIKYRRLKTGGFQTINIFSTVL